MLVADEAAVGYYLFFQFSFMGQNSCGYVMLVTLKVVQAHSINLNLFNYISSLDTVFTVIWINCPHN